MKRMFNVNLYYIEIFSNENLYIFFLFFNCSEMHKTKNLYICKYAETTLKRENFI